MSEGMIVDSLNEISKPLSIHPTQGNRLVIATYKFIATYNALRVPARGVYRTALDAPTTPYTWFLST